MNSRSLNEQMQCITGLCWFVWMTMSSGRSAVWTAWRYWPVDERIDGKHRVRASLNKFKQKAFSAVRVSDLF